jgi:hypothetical protein
VNSAPRNLPGWRSSPKSDPGGRRRGTRQSPFICRREDAEQQRAAGANVCGGDPAGGPGRPPPAGSCGPLEPRPPSGCILHACRAAAGKGRAPVERGRDRPAVLAGGCRRSPQGGPLQPDLSTPVPGLAPGPSSRRLRNGPRSLKHSEQGGLACLQAWRGTRRSFWLGSFWLWAPAKTKLNEVRRPPPCRGTSWSSRGSGARLSRPAKTSPTARRSLCSSSGPCQPRTLRAKPKLKP